MVLSLPPSLPTTFPRLVLRIVLRSVCLGCARPSDHSQLSDLQSQCRLLLTCKVGMITVASTEVQEITCSDANEPPRTWAGPIQVALKTRAAGLIFASSSSSCHCAGWMEKLNEQRIQSCCGKGMEIFFFWLLLAILAIRGTGVSCVDESRRGFSEGLTAQPCPWLTVCPP